MSGVENMKTRIIISIFALLIFFCSCSNETNAEMTEITLETADTTVETQFKYEEFLDHIYLKKYIGNSDVVSIPSEINGKPVTDYDAGLFDSRCVKEVVFSEGITSLPEIRATNHIEKIFIPSTIEEINAEQLMSFYYLEDIEIADGGNFIVDDGVLFTADKKTIIYAFGCNEEYNVPEGVEKLGDYSFSHTTIRSVDLPSTLKTIGEGVFQGCECISCMDIPSSVTSIGKGAFFSTSLDDITLNEGVESIGENAFRQTKLSEIHLPKSIKTVGNHFVDDNCSILAYDPIEPLFDYNIFFINETLYERSMRLLPSIDECTDGRIFIDLNHDGVPECFEYYRTIEESHLLYLNNYSKWKYELGLFDNKLYHYYDNINNCDFYIIERHNDMDNYKEIYRISPLQDGVSVDSIGYLDVISELVSGVVNGKWYMEYTGVCDIISDAMQEYDLLEIIDFDAIAEEYAGEWGFNVYYNEEIDAPSYSAYPIAEENTDLNYVDVEGKLYYKNAGSYIVYDKMNLSELSVIDNVVELELVGKWEDLQCITEFKNIKSLFVNYIEKPSALAEMDGIEKLTIVSAESYDFLADMNGVRMLRLCGAIERSDDFFKVIKDMKSLEYLLVDNYCDFDITAGQLKWLEENMPQIKILYMY